MTLSELRIQLAEARIALRQAKDAHEIVKAIAETSAIEGGCNGKNAEERARNLTVALLNDEGYGKALMELRDCEAAIDRIQADIAAAEDERDADKLRVRDAANQALDRYAAALERLASQRPVTMAVDAALPF